MSTVAILGGGISGLSCAYYLRTLGLSKVKYIFLLEKGPKFGGWIQTTRFPDGAIFEHGPRTLRSGTKAGYNALALAEELGLFSHILPITRQHKAGNKRYILADNQIYELPSGPQMLFKNIPPFNKRLIGNVLKEIYTPKGTKEDETVYEFGSRRFGKEITKYVLDPLCRGICAGDMKEISVKSLFPHIYTLEQKYGSVIAGTIKSPASANILEFKNSFVAQQAHKDVWSMWGLKYGLTDLINALATATEKQGVADLHTNAECSNLAFENKKAIVTVDGDDIGVDHVFSTISSQQLAPLLTSYPDLSKSLASVLSVSVAVVYLEYSNFVLKYDGFGILTPSTSDSKVLGVIFDSCCFPEHNGLNRTRLTCMMGGSWFNDIFGNIETVSEATVLETAVGEVKRFLGINVPPSRYQVEVQRDCITQYTVGHSKNVAKMEDEIVKNNLCLSLLGSSYTAVGVPDCIYNAKLSVKKYLDTLL